MTHASYLQNRRRFGISGMHTFVCSKQPDMVAKVEGIRNRPPYVSNNELDIPRAQITFPHFKARRNKAFEDPCNSQEKKLNFSKI